VQVKLSSLSVILSPKEKRGKPWRPLPMPKGNEFLGKGKKGISKRSFLSPSQGWCVAVRPSLGGISKRRGRGRKKKDVAGEVRSFLPGKKKGWSDVSVSWPKKKNSPEEAKGRKRRSGCSVSYVFSVKHTGGGTGFFPSRTTQRGEKLTKKKE